MVDLLKKIFVFCVLYSCTVTLCAEMQNISVTSSDSDEAIFNAYQEYISPYSEEDANEVLIQTAKFFLGRPYVAATLDENQEEQLVVNLREFDCTTLVETCLALTMTVKSPNVDYATFKDNLRLVRYKDGVIDGYSSRQHYMISWVDNNCKSELLQNISSQLGGVPIIKPINFMSSHSNLYLQLKDNKAEIEKIKTVEKQIQEMDYVVIPRKMILEEEYSILNGDIVIFATAISGLDYSHIGIAFMERGILKMIHASSLYKKVIVESKAMSDYVRSSRNCTGLTVLRLNTDRTDKRGKDASDI